MVTILVIEDNLEIRENTVEILELEGYKVAFAENGSKGLDMAIEIKPALILCDIMMPLINGHDVLKELKENNDTAAIPFVFFTAKTENKEVELGLSLGAKAYIKKPFDAQELLEVVKTVLSDQDKHN